MQGKEYKVMQNIKKDTNINNLKLHIEAKTKAKLNLVIRL